MNTIILNRLIQYIDSDTHSKEVTRVVSNLPEEFLRSFDFDYVNEIMESKIYGIDLKNLYCILVTAIIDLYIENKLIQEVWSDIFKSDILEYINSEIEFKEKVIHIDFTGRAQSKEEKKYIDLAYNCIIDICKNLGFNTLNIEKDISIENNELGEDTENYEYSSEIIHLKK